MLHHIPNYEDLGFKVAPFELGGQNRMFPTLMRIGGFKHCKITVLD